MAWTRWGGRGLWRPIYAIQGASELAVLRQPVTEVTIDPSSLNETAEGNLFGPDTADASQTQDVTTGAGGAGAFSFAGFAVTSRATLPTRLDLIYFMLRPTVDAQGSVSFQNAATGTAGKNLIDGSSSARSGATDSTSTGGTKRSASTGGAEANIRWWHPFIPLNTTFEWLTTQPEFRITPTVLPQGLRCGCVADVVNTAIRVRWNCVWRQVI